MKNVTHMLLWWEIIREQFSFTSIISILALIAALFLGVAIGAFNPVYSAVVAGVIFMVIILVLRLDELTVTLIVAVHIVLDSYLGFDVYQIALLMALVLLLVCYFGCSDDHPWTGARAIFLWVLFLVLSIFPTINGGAFGLTNAIASYFNLVLSAFIMFWLGNMIGKDISAVRRVFQLLSVLATLIAIHTIIEATTGKFLFETSRAQDALDYYSNFQVEGAAGVSRFGSFFVNPNGNATFLSVSFFPLLGLIIESKRLWPKMIYLLEMLLVLLALMFTYSTTAWIAVLVGILAFLFLSGRIHYSAQLLMWIVTLAVIVFTVFPSSIATQLAHATDQSDRSVHQGTLQTAAQVIEAYPLFGVGLGDHAYLLLSNPYRVPSQDLPLAEPDNSYLQWGAMAGIPVMLVFLLLLGLAFWFSWRNWLAVDTRYRSLLGGGIVALIALSINSLTADSWTNPAGIAILGWLIAGLVSSPLIGGCRCQQATLSVVMTTEVAHAQAESPRRDKVK